MAVACWRHSNKGVRLQEEEKVWAHDVAHKKACSCSERIIEKKGGAHSVGTQKRGGVEVREPEGRRRGGFSSCWGTKRNKWRCSARS